MTALGLPSKFVRKGLLLLRSGDVRGERPVWATLASARGGEGGKGARIRRVQWPQNPTPGIQAVRVPGAEMAVCGACRGAMKRCRQLAYVPRGP